MPYQPQAKGKISVDGPGLKLREKADPKASYTYQLEAFRDAVAGSLTNRTGPAAAIETMETIDAIYLAAGMGLREPS
jgi:predicted dehydrogenase